MEVSEEKEGEVLDYLCRMERVEFGDVGAETMIGEIRKFIREQRRVEIDRRMKEEQEIEKHFKPICSRITSTTHSAIIRKR